MSTTFDYEFVFSTGSFDQVVYDACTIPDIGGGRQQLIQDKVTQIQNIFNNMVSLNLHQFSTFATYEDKNYKVTVANPNWGQ